VLAERVDLLEGAEDLARGGGEDERVRGLADALLLVCVQLGRADVLQGADDAAVCLGALAVQSSLIASIRRVLTDSVTLRT
jgi:hypothetical protein